MIDDDTFPPCVDAWWYQAWLRLVKLPARQLWLKARGYTMSEHEARLMQVLNLPEGDGCLTCRRRRCRCNPAKEAA